MARRCLRLQRSHPCELTDRAGRAGCRGRAGRIGHTSMSRKVTLLVVVVAVLLAHPAWPLNLLDEFVLHDDNNIQGSTIFVSSLESPEKCATLCVASVQCLAFIIKTGTCEFKNATLFTAGAAYTVEEGVQLYERARITPPSHVTCASGSFSLGSAPSWIPIQVKDSCPLEFSKNRYKPSCVPSSVALQSEWFEKGSAGCNFRLMASVKAINEGDSISNGACCGSLKHSSLYLRTKVPDSKINTALITLLTYDFSNIYKITSECKAISPTECYIYAGIVVDRSFSVSTYMLLLILLSLCEEDTFRFISLYISAHYQLKWTANVQRDDLNIYIEKAMFYNCGFRNFMLECPSDITTFLPEDMEATKISIPPAKTTFSSRTTGFCSGSARCTSSANSETTFGAGRHTISYTCHSDEIIKKCSFGITVRKPGVTPMTSTPTTDYSNCGGACVENSHCEDGQCVCDDKTLFVFHGECVYRPAPPADFKVHQKDDGVVLTWNRDFDLTVDHTFILTMKECDSSTVQERDLGFPVVPFNPSKAADHIFEYQLKGLQKTCWLLRLTAITSDERQVPGIPSRTVQVDLSRPPSPSPNPATQDSTANPNPQPGPTIQTQSQPLPTQSEPERNEKEQSKRYLPSLMLLNQKFALCHSFYLEGFCVYSLKVLTIYIDRPNRQTLTAAIALASIVLVLGVSLGTYRLLQFQQRRWVQNFDFGSSVEISDDADVALLLKEERRTRIFSAEDDEEELGTFANRDKSTSAHAHHSMLPSGTNQDQTVSQLETAPTPPFPPFLPSSSSLGHAKTSVKRSVLIGTGVFVVDTQDEQTSTIDQPSREVQRQQLRERLRADLLSRHNQESLPTQSRDGNGDGSHEDHDQASEDSVENRGLVSTDIDSRMNSNTDLSDFCEDE
eukprot:gene10510-2638_t